MLKLSQLHHTNIICCHHQITKYIWCKGKFKKLNKNEKCHQQPHETCVYNNNNNLEINIY